MHQSCPHLLLVVLSLVIFALFLSSTPVDGQQAVDNRGVRPSGGGNGNGASCNRNTTFDQFVLSIQWPGSFCHEKENACNLAAARNRKWLIHGLWPNRVKRSQNRGGNSNSNNSFNDIAFCCGPSYNSSAINSTLNRQLTEKWPTLHSNGRHHAFWGHEWKKHGTCARGVDKLKSQQAYFNTVLQLYGRFDLNRAALNSNSNYSLVELHRTIDPLVGGKKVRIECSLSGGGSAGNGKKASPTSIFSEVHICLDKSLQAIDCNRGDDHQCRGRVLFP